MSDRVRMYAGGEITRFDADTAPLARPAPLFTTQALAGWGALPHEFPITAINAANDVLVDIIACMIAGRNDPATRAAAASIESFGSGEAFAFCGPKRLPAPWAAFVNATAAHALDFDDNFAPAFTHATAVLAPALLAIADVTGASGSDVIDAFIIGLELQARIGRVMQPGHYEAGWHSTSTIGLIGTAGACARLLGADATQILAAMSAATSMAGGSKVQFGSMMKPVHAGLAAKNAVLAAHMAMAGITGNTEPLAGPWGYAALAAGGLDAADMLSGADDTLAILTDGLLAKRFPCCGAAHRSIDGVEMLRNQPGFDLQAISSVDSHLPEMARRNLRFDCPADEMQARFSGTYCMARMLVAGRLELKDFTPDSIADPVIQQWLPRIQLISYDNDRMIDGAHFDVLTRFHMKDGTTREVTVSIPKGAPENPLSPEDIAGKFASCCAWTGVADKAGPLLILAGALGSAPDISRILGHIGEYLIADR